MLLFEVMVWLFQSHYHKDEKAFVETFNSTQMRGSVWLVFSVECFLYSWKGKDPGVKN